MCPAVFAFNVDVVEKCAFAMFGIRVLAFSADVVKKWVGTFVEMDVAFVSEVCGSMPLHGENVDLAPLDSLSIAGWGEAASATGVLGRGKLMSVSRSVGSHFVHVGAVSGVASVVGCFAVETGLCECSCEALTSP